MTRFRIFSKLHKRFKRRRPQPRRRSSGTRAARCSLPWMAFWGDLANFLTREFRVRVRADAFDAMLRSTWLCPHRIPLHWFTSPLRATRLASCTCVSGTCRKWLTDPCEATRFWRLTGRHDRCFRRSKMTRSPHSPQTNRIAARFNDRIGEVLQTLWFNRALDINQRLLRCAELCNHQLPKSALQSKTPIQVMKQWSESHPDLFSKRPYNRPGRDT